MDKAINQLSFLVPLIKSNYEDISPVVCLVLCRIPSDSTKVCLA